MHWPNDEWIRFGFTIFVLVGILNMIRDCATHLKAVADALEKRDRNLN